ncbi:MAG: 3D domain-containing protein [Bdellovibrio sp.]
MSLSPTIYYKPTIHLNKLKCSNNDLRDMKTQDDRTLVTVCFEDFKLCLKQGSCFIEDGGKVTSYNYHATKNGEPRFVEVDTKRCPYGYGVKSNCLEPYFSAAADLNYHAIGEVIFIPRLIGLILPSGVLHDGYIIIRDSGGSIIGPDRFDFFTGFVDHLSKDNPFARLGLGDPKNRFEYRKVTDFSEAESVRKKRNYPNLP